MKQFILIGLALLVSVSLAQAAEVITVAGTRELVFQFNGLSELGLAGYEGGVGARTYLSDGMALRGGLVFSSSSVTLKEGGASATARTTDIGAALVVELHTQARKSVSPYMGGGVSFESVSMSIESASAPTATAFGLFGVAGFAWGVAESISLGGEYRLGLRSVSGLVSNSGYDMSTLDIGFGTASVFLSVKL